MSDPDSSWRIVATNSQDNRYAVHWQFVQCAHGRRADQVDRVKMDEILYARVSQTVIEVNQSVLDCCDRAKALLASLLYDGFELKTVPVRVVKAVPGPDE